jgi:hypothetical protein
MKNKTQKEMAEYIVNWLIGNGWDPDSMFMIIW